MCALSKIYISIKVFCNNYEELSVILFIINYDLDLYDKYS